MDLLGSRFFYISSLLCLYCVSAEMKLFGLHSDELISGELVLPKKVNKHGEFLSHNLEHYHKKNFDENRYQLESDSDPKHHRRKRNIERIAKEDTVHYHLDVDNQTLHLELEPHSYFMSPNLVIERHRRDLRTRTKPSQIAKCHFHGKVRGHSDSRVAVSTCKGLVGHIKTNTDQYYIEPSKNHVAHPNKGHPHVVFRQSSVKDKKNKVNKKRKHRRKSKGKYHQSVSNCGTKEPRRRIETRIEWQSLGKVKIQEGRKIKRHRNGNKKHKPEETYQDLRRKQNKFKYRTSSSETEIPIKSLKNLNGKTENGGNDGFSQSNGKSRSSSNSKSGISNISSDSSITSSSNRSNKNDKIITYTTINNTIINDHKMETNKVHQRKKRSVSTPRHVETLIVADSTMVGFHTNDTETYLLTIMNMVSALYKDPSIGNSIEIVIVKIILLEEDQAHWDLNLTQNAQQNLNSFCRWQNRLNTENENDPYHHDVAILVTRKNICGNNCMTLGLANVGGMCNPKQSCSVNEDNGIMLSHTIAHELGHNFGMFHDSAKIGCHPRIGSIVHIMTPTFGADTLQVSWSNCSRKYITHFLDQGLGDCLDDMPNERSKQYTYPEQPAGALFNAELQCRLQFNMSDSKVTACSELNEICSILWCEVNGECVTNMRPTAPGTACGNNRWCQNGKCVPNRELRPVDGGWGSWSEWSECSTSCGGGVSTQQRECDNPLPKNGGLFCIGERKRYKICNTNVCPPDEPNFRATQCAKYDFVPYQGAIYKWLPHFDKDQPCKLFCTDFDDTIIANWGEGVLDGTPCTLGTNNMCIDGICKKVGCDWNIDSDLQEDRCGICGGKGDKCKPIGGTFAIPFNITEGYLKILTIPAKARHIIIKELGNTQHFLAIAKANSNEFYLNGDSLISMPGEFIIAGAESLYERMDEQEVISIPHPIEYAISVYVIVRGKEENEGISYEFTLPAVNETNLFKYSWEQGNWSSCSKSCGGGIQYLEPLCLKNGIIVSEAELCWKHAKNTRPAIQIRICNKKKCPAVWWTGPWQFCQATCHQKGTPLPKKRRSVVCLGSNEIVTDDHHCNGNTKPSEVDNCDEELPECRTTSFIDDNHLLHLQNL